MVWCLISGGCTYDYQGNEFILTFLENYNSKLPLELYIVTPSAQEVDVSVRLPLSDTFEDQEFTVTPGEMRRVELPSTLQTTGTASGDNGVLIRASGDIIVQAMNSEDTNPASCGGFQVMPVDALGQDYFVLSLWPEFEGEFEYSQFAIVATEDDTEITIRFPFGRGVVITYDGDTYDEDRPLTVTFDAYQTLQVQSDSGNDLSGTRIESSSKIAVFSGDLIVRTNEEDVTTDHIVEQMMPTSSWGTTFGAVALPDQDDGYSIHFITHEDETVVEVNGDVYEIDEAGSYLGQGVHIQDGTYVGIQSDKPIMVVQIAKSQISSTNGGPAMVLIPPVQQYQSDYTFAIPPGKFYQTYILLIIEESETDNLSLDGGAVDIEWQNIPGSVPLLVGGYFQVDDGQVHRVLHSKNAPFGAYVYGHDNNTCSFAYVAGMCLGDPTEVN